MKRKRIFISLCILILIIITAIILALESWSRTPHGRLDYRAAVILKFIGLFENKELQRTPEKYRKVRNSGLRMVAGTPVEVAGVRNMTLPGPAAPIPVRIYTPKGSAPPYPVVLYYHGGGFVMGNLDTHDNLCRALAGTTPAVVISVDYRLAPENRFPAAVDDAYAALAWASRNAALFRGDAERIAVAGDSAGGNLAAVISQLARDRKGPAIAAQVLIYPTLDMAHLNTESYEFFKEGYLLTRKGIDWFLDQYVPNRGDRMNPMASPILARDLRRLPSAIVVTAQFDVLRDEGETYARKLKEAGVAVTLVRYKGMIHGFLVVDRWFPQAREATRRISSELHRIFYPSR